ncbi:PLD-like domain-containing protein [Methylobacterium brachiatum]|nr:PLD-like domain-containing protein [Methylobacterium brachiatum]
MRREGDQLVAHLAGARKEVTLCAPFVKAGVLRRLLATVPSHVPVVVVTRWKAPEIAAGVSDLEVFDVAGKRPGASLALLDELHAKIYVSDGVVLTGSANLTAKALGWCERPNLEILVPIDASYPSVVNCLAAIAGARRATSEERDQIAEEARGLAQTRIPEAQDEDAELASMWLPKLGDPARLFPVYAGLGLDRMMASTVEAAGRDLTALAIPSGLREPEFRAAAARAFASMPAIERLLTLVDEDLVDEDAVAEVASTPMNDGMPPDQQWLVVREWMAHLLSDRVEIVPQSFVTRRRPGGTR